ncbi:hypothetical protein CLHOM_01850 [Clostridium homopropionicum DSM 5847]|uniref:Nucleotidyl transferase AbiEii toxin, Type IV TA system n=1 Tax=Clostridium homopropionicum DSM 5847 TaxID=1121318 RepID=A0A0L6ZEU8_9CLOT|nr:nucleotidyl transferase AbiEii/AbiGii toxin family protein [Clostridium homopropionicum]KOA21514.1 hypothetical protein CLHOM_01850 [Clostridium homopropionicum DSM 5847]SFG07201.1 Nucleotidyl transferase AbiEii toxin, Type IV TA system [Clostridium homopropionicum]
MKTNNLKRMSLLKHKYSSFLEDTIASEANYYGIYNKSILERHIWIYEIHSQLQSRLKDNCILKGGACAQLYIPLEKQRCTEDLDLYTSLTPNKLRTELSSLGKEFNQSKLKTSIREYIPKGVRDVKNKMPITTFLVSLPFIFKENKKNKRALLKIDFLHVNIKKIETNKVKNAYVLGLKLNYEPNCITPHALMAGKLMVFAVNTIGIEKFKKDKLYKNIYDLFYLVNKYNSLQDMDLISKYFMNSIGLEFYLKGINPIEIEYILQDILQELKFLYTESINKEYIETNEKVQYFIENYLQYNIESKLNLKTIGSMANYLLHWTYAFEAIVLYKDFDNFSSIEATLNELKSIIDE